MTTRTPIKEIPAIPNQAGSYGVIGEEKSP